MKYSYFYYLLVILLFMGGIDGKSANLLSPLPYASEKTETYENDSIWTLPPTTAVLKDAITYFRKNNKYKEWDSSNRKVVILGAITEKDGTLTNLTVIRGDIEKLNKEAIRLVQEAKIKPAEDYNGNPVRSKWVIAVDFPPK